MAWAAWVRGLVGSVCQIFGVGGVGRNLGVGDVGQKQAWVNVLLFNQTR